MTIMDQPSHTKQEKQPPTLNKLQEEKALSQRGPRSPMFCTEGFLMAKVPQAQTQREDTQSRPDYEVWAKPYLLTKGWGTPRTGEMEQLQIEI